MTAQPATQPTALGVPRRIVIIGLGNEFRRDDAAGICVARQVEAKCMANVVVHEPGGDGIALLASCSGADALIVIDAVSSGAGPGTIYRFDARLEPIPARFSRCSTHALGIVEAIELARALNQLPPQLIVYGIEGEDFEAGFGLSSKVTEAVANVVERVAQEVQCTNTR